MSDEHSLMRPLRNDSLKPRPSTQAVWEPAAPLHVYEAPDLPAFTPSKTVSLVTAPLQPDISTPEKPPQPTAAEEPEAVQEKRPAPPAVPVGHQIASLISEEPEEETAPLPELPAQDSSLLDNVIASIVSDEPEALPQAEPSLSDIIASILAEDEDDDEDVSASHDAFPSKNMPEPACVPLYEEPAPRRKKRSWLWLLLLMLLAGSLYAAWHFGYVTINLP